MEVPDIADWVKPHDLLVTTGFPLASGEDHRRRHGRRSTRLIRDLHARGLDRARGQAGPVRRHGRPRGAGPGRRARLPGAGAADGVGLRRPAAPGLRPAQRAHRRGPGAHRRAAPGADAAGARGRRPRPDRGRGGPGARPGGADHLDRRPAARRRPCPIRCARRLEQADLLEPGGRFRVERASTRPAPVGDGEVRLQPIVAGGTDLARLVCFSPHRPLSHDDVVAMERAATVAALLVTRQEAVAAVENKYRGDFLRDVFLGRAGDRTYVTEHAASLGWDLGEPDVRRLRRARPDGCRRAAGLGPGAPQLAGALRDRVAPGLRGPATGRAHRRLHRRGGGPGPRRRSRARRGDPGGPAGRRGAGRPRRRPASVLGRGQPAGDLTGPAARGLPAGPSGHRGRAAGSAVAAAPPASTTWGCTG